MDEQASSSPTPSSQTPKSKNYILIALGALAVLVIGFFVFNRFSSSTTQTTTPTPTETPTTAASPSTQQVIYKGVSPCADCSGIDTTLTLNYDGTDNTSGTYSQSMVYQGKSTEPVTQTGTWKSLPNDVIELTPSGSNPQPSYYKQTSPSTLEALGINQQPLPSPANYTLTAQ